MEPSQTETLGGAIRPLEIGTLAVSPPLLQAPMAGFTNYAYRQMIRGLGGVGLPATEMLSARSFVERDARGKNPPDRMWGIRDEPRPLAVQIWDNDPEKLAAVGARLAHEYRASVVDINFGCPVPVIAQNARSGSYLLRDPARVGELVARVAEACRPTPVTAKIRLGWTRDTINAIDVAQAVEGAGGALLTVHGRTAQDLYRGQANWDEIARIKPHLKRIPLVGNGDIRSAEAAAEAFARYGVDGVMIGRAALGRPWLFAQAAAALAGLPVPPEPSLAGQRELLLAHYELILERFGPQRGTVLMRRYACCYGHGFRGAREFRGRVATAATPEDFRQLVETFFPQSS